MSQDLPNRQQLYQVKLATLVRERWGVTDATLGGRPGGATLRADHRGWVLAEESPERARGGALAWGRREGVAELHVLAPAATGLLARRAAAFAVPPHVWRVDGRALEEAESEPRPSPPPLSDAVAAWADPIRSAGAEPVVEGDVLRAEVLGLEVGRVVQTGDEAVLEVGVGKHDREAQKLVHGDRQPLIALADAVAAVTEARLDEGHEMHRLAAERWLRAVVVRHPEIVGASHLEPVPAPTPPGDLRLLAPAFAAGPGLLVACSTGIDVDVVPSAADMRGYGQRLVLLLPEQDVHPVTRDLAAALRDPAEVVTVGADWRRQYPL